MIAEMIGILLLLQFAIWNVEGRLAIVSSSPEAVLIKSGEGGRLWCQSSQPWFLCVWKGPNNVAITKTQNHECNGNRSDRMRVLGRGVRCELDISEVQLGDAGDYSCVLADQEEVLTVTQHIFLNVGVSSKVHWVQGDVAHFNTEDSNSLSLTCEASPGFPRPSLVIRSQSLALREESRVLGDPAVESRTVLVDSNSMMNNSMVTCHAEQRDEMTGNLVYNSSVVSLRLEEVIVPLLLNECVEWWCEYQVFLFIMLVMAVLILISCCGMYFFFATRGKPYNVIMYNSEHGTWNRDESVVKEKLLEKKENANNPNLINRSGLNIGADIIRPPPPTDGSLNQSIYSQVDKSKKSVKKTPEIVVSPPPLLETDLDQTFNNVTDDSIMHRIVTDFDTTNESSSFLSKNQSASNATTLQDTSALTKSTVDEEEEKRKMLLTMTEEEIMMSNSETTLEMIYRKYRSKNKSQGTLNEEEMEDDFVGETEMRKYALHKYHLANVKNVKRLGRTYSKVVRDHLSNNPKLAVSESSVEFEVARPSSSLSFCQARSNASTPLPPFREKNDGNS